MNLDSLIYGGEFPLDLKKTIKFRNLKILNKGSYTLSGRSALYLIIKHLSKNRIKNAILDNQCQIPAGTVIGESPDLDAKQYPSSEDGVIVVNRRLLGQGERYFPSVITQNRSKMD